MARIYTKPKFSRVSLVKACKTALQSRALCVYTTPQRRSYTRQELGLTEADVQRLRAQMYDLQDIWNDPAMDIYGDPR